VPVLREHQGSRRREDQYEEMIVEMANIEEQEVDALLHDGPRAVNLSQG
jgi:hypothetical protein